jgi:NTP pyrophosphatase (non-canonical NTP hydrolase)
MIKMYSNDLDVYQEEAFTYAIKEARCIPYMVYGIAGEVGELSSWYAKTVRDGYGSRDFNDVKKELGDILWFVAGLCSVYGLKLSDIAKMNIEKLESRKNRNVIKGDGDNR